MQPAFSQDDLFAPMYCRQCHKHTPKAELIPNDGYCPPCSLQRAQAALQAKQRAEEEAERQRLAIYNKNTGHGFCPECKSTNVDLIEISADNAARKGMVSAGKTTTVASGLFFWPGLLLSLPLWFSGSRQPKQTVVGHTHKCVACGFEW